MNERKDQNITSSCNQYTTMSHTSTYEYNSEYNSITMGARKSTLYPKITTHIKDVVKTLKNTLRDPDNPDQEPILDPIPIIGTVKLHGTHADIIISPSNTLTFQSRNNDLLTPSNDNHDFLKSMSTKHPAILALRSRLLSRWHTLNPTTPLDPTLPITIAGEWIGHNIQSHVAISQLPRRFVIISLRINGAWLPDEPYADIEDPANDLYHVSRGGIYRATLYPQDPQRTADALAPLTERVAARCPFAASFGVLGEGEGLVWKMERYAHDPELWFKTKGGRFRPTFAPKPRRVAVGKAEREEVARVLAEGWCTVGRLEQGWDYLRETGVGWDIKGLGTFLKWVQGDVLVEERGYIKENGVDEEGLKRGITRVAKGWYLERLKAME